MLYASKLSLNSPKHALLQDSRIAWSENPPEGAWCIGDRLAARSLESIYETCDKDVPSLIPPEFVSSMDGLSQGAVPWSSRNVSCMRTCPRSRMSSKSFWRLLVTTPMSWSQDVLSSNVSCPAASTLPHFESPRGNRSSTPF